MKKMLEKQALLITVLLFSFLSCRQAKEEAPAKEETFGMNPVKVVKVARQKISERLLFTGTLEPWQRINITPDIGGKITKIYVKEGDRVRQGDLLAELDTQSIRLQLQQAEAALSVAQANFNDAKKNFERMEKLKQENAVSEQQYEKIRLAYEAAEAQLRQAKATVDLARHSLDVSLMRAPFSGVISSRNAEVGDVINPMMGSFSAVRGVVTLVDFSKVKINLEVPPGDVNRIQKGQPAILKVSTLPNREFPGKVTLVNLAADPASRKFKVEVVVDNPDLLLRLGTFGQVTVEVSTREDSLAVPQSAIIDNKYIFLAQGNKAKKVEVALGLQNSSLVEIMSGIQEGDLVIVEGNYGLVDGADIQVIEVKQ